MMIGKKQPFLEIGIKYNTLCMSVYGMILKFCGGCQPKTLALALNIHDLPYQKNHRVIKLWFNSQSVEMEYP